VIAPPPGGNVYRQEPRVAAYYEVDLAGNVRRLRGPGGTARGGSWYTAFGKTLEDTATLEQPLRWKGRPHEIVGALELYDMRARVWAPELGTFLSIDEYRYHHSTSTLWGWPGQNPIRWSDPDGRCGAACVGAVLGGVAGGLGYAFTARTRSDSDRFGALRIPPERSRPVPIQSRGQRSARERTFVPHGRADERALRGRRT